MPRHPRVAPGGLVYHAINRATARLPLFEKDADFDAFERVIEYAQRQHPTRILAYCAMPNHWHFVLWPRHDGELSAFLRCLAHTHTQRWHAHHGTAGTGHLYQGRFKSFPVQDDPHLTTVLRYVERNPLRAKLVPRAEAWRWSSLGQHALPADDPSVPTIPIAPWPVARRRDWVAWVNRAQTPVEEAAILRSLTHGRPYGSDTWTVRTERRLRLGPLRPRGRPRGWRKVKAKAK